MTDYNTLYENLQDINNIIQKLDDVKYIDIVLKSFNYPTEINNLIKEDITLVTKIVDFLYRDTLLKKEIMTMEEIMEQTEMMMNSTKSGTSKMHRFRTIILNWLKASEFFNDIISSNDNQKCTTNNINPTDSINPTNSINSTNSINPTNSFNPTNSINPTNLINPTNSINNLTNSINNLTNSISNTDSTINDTINATNSNENINKLVVGNAVAKNVEIYNRRISQQEGYDLLLKNGIQTGIHCQATGCGKTFLMLEYLKFVSKRTVMLFTERVNILSDLFLVNRDVNMDNINKWKNMGICDLTGYNIVNRVTIKKHDWVDILLNVEKPVYVTRVNRTRDTTKIVKNPLVYEKKKPVFLIINRAFLTSKDNYKSITNENLALVLHDECHNAPSQKCNDFLKHCKKQNIPIVGFSATPIRSSKKERERLVDIYSNDNKTLNLLTNYNMMYAIRKNLILPPEFHWYNIESYNKIINDTNDSDDQSVTIVDENKITDNDVNSVLVLLNSIITKLFRKKIIAWCGTIEMTNKWKSEFQTKCKNYENLKNLTFGIDTSKHYNQNYLDFKNSKGSSILFCACKHREGSDIKYLDCCIFLDKVKNRGNIPFIQSIGRVLRICPETPEKTRGIIVDCVAVSENYDKEFVEKILGYYLALENMATITDDAKNKYQAYINLMGKITFDKETNKVKFSLTNNNFIEINCNVLEWNKIVVKFNSVLKEKCELGEIEELRIQYEQDIKKNKSLNIKSDTEYLQRADELQLTKDPKGKYVNLWSDWYDYLGIDKSVFPETFQEWVNKCKLHKLHNEILYNKNYEKFNLPPMIEELYNQNKFSKLITRKK